MPFGAAVGAAVAGAAVSGGIGLIGGALQSGKAGAGAAQSAELARQQRADLEPWRTTGGVANTASADLLGLNGQGAANAAMGNFQKSPGYQWSFDQGLRGVDAGAAAKGMLRSGATLKAEQTFGTGLADQEFQKYYSNLMGVSQLGESAAAGGAYTAANAGSQAQQAGNTQASIYGNTATGLGNTVNKLFADPAVQGWMGGGSTNNNDLIPAGGFNPSGNTWYK